VNHSAVFYRLDGPDTATRADKIRAQACSLSMQGMQRCSAACSSGVPDALWQHWLRVASAGHRHCRCCCGEHWAVERTTQLAKQADSLGTRLGHTVKRCATSFQEGS